MDKDGYEMAAHNELGEWGEEQAEDYLLCKGYYVRHRDWRCGHRDLDIVAVAPDGQTLVFVEVKTRSNATYQEPEDAVDVRKIRSIAQAANNYVKAFHIKADIRFDIIAVTGVPGGEVNIRHTIDAFLPV